MTILDVGRCLGSGEPPRERTEEGTSGICVACSGRFEVEDGRIVAHQAADEDAREALEPDDSATS